MTLELGPILRAMARNKVRFGLIVCEVALTLAVVANCVSMIREARAKMVIPSGFADADIVSVQSLPFEAAFREEGYLANSVREDLAALRALPGVQSASVTRFLPWQGGGSSSEFKVAGAPQATMLRSQIYPADERILEALGVEVTEGRVFTRDEAERDTQRLRELTARTREKGKDGKPIEKFTQDVVITRAIGKLAFGEGPLLGKMLEDSDGDLYRVIGVIDRFYNPYGWPIHEYGMFYANTAGSYEFGTRYLVRAQAGQRDAVMAALDARLSAVNAGRTVQLRTLDEIKDRYFAGQRVVVTLMGGLSVLLVMVTSLGIVGLTAFSVTERTKQIGTRRALGARKLDVVRHFLVENWLVTTMGAVLGVGLAYGLNLMLTSAVGGVRLDPALVGGGVLLLWTAGIGSTLLPALRAAQISPAIATRNV